MNILRKGPLKTRKLFKFRKNLFRHNFWNADLVIFLKCRITCFFNFSLLINLTVLLLMAIVPLNSDYTNYLIK